MTDQKTDLLRDEIEGIVERAILDGGYGELEASKDILAIIGSDLAPKVKPLEWESIYDLGTLEQAKTSIGIYTISDDEDKAFGTFVYLHLTPDGDCTKYGVQVLESGPFEVYEAKAAAQADYERRILSAIDTGEG